MTATAQLNGAWTPISDHNAIPGWVARPLAASAQVGKGQLVTVDPATGYASLNDGTSPSQIAAGVGDFAELSDTSSTAGAASARVTFRWFYGLAASTVTNDGFTDADFGVPFYIASENTLGKLSNYGGSNRSVGGLVFGLAVDGTPVAWCGPIAALIARGLLIANSFNGGEIRIADAAASTATAETAMHRHKVHGVVTAVEYIGAAIAADNTDYVTVTVAKRDGAGGGAGLRHGDDRDPGHAGACPSFRTLATDPGDATPLRAAARGRCADRRDRRSA
jgi:hypothetical protein